MSLVIIYKNDNGGVSVIYPTPEALAIYSIKEIALKDVPAPKKIYDVPTGVFETDPETLEAYEVMDFRIKEYPYKIIDSSELPDRVSRSQWDVDEADLTDGVGSESNEFN
jgi:hypothetical protein